MDFSKLGNGARITLVGGLVLLIASFLDWYGAGPFGISGWDSQFWAVFGILLGTETIQLNLLTGGRTENNLEADLGWFMYGGAVVWATIDGYVVAKRLNRENGYHIAHWPGTPPDTGPQLTLVRFGF